MVSESRCSLGETAIYAYPHLQSDPECSSTMMSYRPEADVIEVVSTAQSQLLRNRPAQILSSGKDTYNKRCDEFRYLGRINKNGRISRSELEASQKFPLFAEQSSVCACMF